LAVYGLEWFAESRTIEYEMQGVRDTLVAQSPVSEAPAMQQNLTLEYWIDDGWYVGRLKGIPGVFSQGETLQELEENVADAYHMMLEEDELPTVGDIHTKEIEVRV
jgi:predicted RNase H-like HicB family nuclease